MESQFEIKRWIIVESVKKRKPRAMAISCTSYVNCILKPTTITLLKNQKYLKPYQYTFPTPHKKGSNFKS